jgi:hypothetical protein
VKVPWLASSLTVGVLFPARVSFLRHVQTDDVDPVTNFMEQSLVWEANSTIRAEDSGSTFLWNVGIYLRVHTISLPRRPTSISQSLSEPQISFASRFWLRSQPWMRMPAVSQLRKWCRLYRHGSHEEWMVLLPDSQKLIIFAENEWDINGKIKYRCQGFYNSQPLVSNSVCMFTLNSLQIWIQVKFMLSALIWSWLLWDVAPCSLVKIHGCVKSACCLHHQGDK